MIHKIFLLCAKELKDYFYSIKTYISLAIYLAISGYIISNYVSAHNSTNIEGALPNLILLFILFIPLMCVISIRKETKFGANKMIIASSTTLAEIIISKFISIYIISLVALSLNCLQFVLVRFIDVISFRILASVFFGYAILLLSIVGICLLFAIFTDNNYLNYMITLIVLIILMLLKYLYEYIKNDFESIHFLVYSQI